jgi:hypothetical protein
LGAAVGKEYIWSETVEEEQERFPGLGSSKLIMIAQVPFEKQQY